MPISIYYLLSCSIKESAMRRLTFMCVIMLMIYTTGLQAQTGTPVDVRCCWSSWLYDNVSRRLWLIESSGAELASLTLPVPDSDYSLLSSTVGISHSGRYIAYVVQGRTDLDYRFQIYDRDIRTMFSGIYTPPTGGFQQHSLDISGGTRVFSPDDRYLAVAFSQDDTWELLVIDMQASPSPRVVYTLRSSDPAVAPTPMAEGFGYPVVQRVTASTVAFTYLNSIEGAPEFPNYTWDFTTGTLSASNIYRRPLADVLEATGEVLVSYQNTAYPNRLDRLEYPLQFNVVQVSSPSEGTFIYYNHPDRTVDNVLFVQNGERVLLSEYDYTDSQRYWLLRERDGTQLDRIVQPWQFNSIAGTPDGFVLTGTNLLTDESGVLVDYSTRGASLGTMRSIWNAPPDVRPRIVAVNHVPAVDPAGFMPWSRIGSVPTATPLPGSDSDRLPRIEASPTPGSSGRPLAAGELVVGGTARVYTTEGDMLNVRSDPGTAFAVVTRLATDDRVTILEGPISADGLTWWRIEASDGTTGWAVDFVDDIPTLIPE
jgi:hypothetical protein